MKSVATTIRAAERILPGSAARKSQIDRRWQAVIAVGEFVRTNPEEVWAFAAKWGCHRSTDLRAAISTCILEHLLEYHFRRIFPRAVNLARNNRKFVRTLSTCWLMGQAEKPKNAKAFRAVLKDLKHAI